MIPPPPRRRLSSDLHTISSVQSETSGAGEVVCKKETFPLFGDEIVGAKCEPREGFQNKVQELLRDFDEYCRPSLQKNYSCPFSGRPRSQTEDGPYGFARKQRSEGGYREDGKSRLRGFLLKELVAEATLEDEPDDMTKIQNTVCASDNSEGTSFSEREALMGPASRCSSTSLSPPLLTPESTLIGTTRSSRPLGSNPKRPSKTAARHGRMSSQTCSLVQMTLQPWRRWTRLPEH